MSGKKQRLLRQMARQEMANDPGVVDHELVLVTQRDRFGKPHDKIVTNPNSVQAMTNALKKAYKKANHK